MFPSDQGYFRNLYFQPYNDRVAARLRNSTKDSKYVVENLTLEYVSNVHPNCVNSLHWNDAGNKLISAGDDGIIIISDPFKKVVDLRFKTTQRSILCAKFLNNHKIISCGFDGSVLVIDLYNNMTQAKFNYCYCHKSACYALEKIPGEPDSFLSCSEDGTIRKYDLRTKVECSQEQCFSHVLIDCYQPVTAIAINPLRLNQLAIATADSMVRIVDRRKIIAEEFPYKIVPERSFTVPELNHRSYRISSLFFSPDGKDMLVNYSSEEIYLFNIDEGLIWKKPPTLAYDLLKNSPKPPPYKRLRMRGDWADTGPLSQPSDSEARARVEVAFMTRISDMLLFMLNSTSIPQMCMRNNSRPETPREDETNSTPSNRLVSLGEAFPIDEDMEPLVFNFSARYEQASSDDGYQRTDLVETTIVDRTSIRFDDHIPIQPIKRMYTGHRNSRTLKSEATFWGNNYIISGSDCGHVFIWDRHTSEIVMLLEADKNVVICIQPHPNRPTLATAGVHGIKLWSPIYPKNIDPTKEKFSQSFANELAERNRLMAIHSSDAVTVAPEIIIRMMGILYTLQDGDELD